VPTISTLLYSIVSFTLNFDKDIIPISNYHGEIENGLYKHSFIPLSKTIIGDPVDVVYHVVECGDINSEPIVFFHGLAETWRVWADIMKPFCNSHRAIAIDIEGQGQSHWPNVKSDLANSSDARGFMGQMQLELLNKLNVSKFNLVVTDYGFWTSLRMLTSAKERILRYGKFQSTVGVEDPNRVPQAKLFKFFPSFMIWLLNLSPSSLPRVLFGKPLLKLKSLLSNSRIGPNGISDDLFRDIILSGIQPGMFTSWVLFYHYGKDAVSQMEEQLEAFRQSTYPVYMLQGKCDLGQPNYLFNGTARMDIIDSPISGISERILRTNTTHKLRVKYSKNIIGPLPESFFPNR